MGPEGNSTPAAVSLKNDVRELIKSKHEQGTIRQQVVNTLADAEVNRRANLLATALQKRDEQDREIKKIKPDHRTVSENGEKAEPVYSEDTWKKRQKAVEKLAKIDKAIDKAINDADYDGLKKVGNDKEEKDESDSSDE